MAAQAQSGSYTITQSVIAGGGDTSTEVSGRFSLTGAIGQSITETSTTVPFKINSGFFTAPALAPPAAMVSVGGRVITAGGRGVRNVRVTLSGANGDIGTALTSAFGYYRFTEVPAGETYILTVAAKRYTFSQPTQIRMILEDIHDVDFIADDLK